MWFGNPLGVMLPCRNATAMNDVCVLTKLQRAPLPRDASEGEEKQTPDRHVSMFRDVGELRDRSRSGEGDDIEAQNCLAESLHSKQSEVPTTIIPLVTFL